MHMLGTALIRAQDLGEARENAIRAIRLFHAPATPPGSRSPRRLRLSPSPMTTCRGPPGCGAPRGPCRRPAASGWPTSSTSSTTSDEPAERAAGCRPEDLAAVRGRGPRP